MTIEAAPTTTTPAPTASQPTSAPPATAPVAPKPAKPSGPDMTKVADLLARKGLKPRDATAPSSPTAPTAAPAGAGGGAPASTGETPPSSAPTADAPAEGDSKLALRLARIAKEEARVKAEAEKLKAERAKATEDPDFKRFQSFKEQLGKSKAAALRALFDTDDDFHSAYNEVTDYIIDGAKPVTDADKRAADEKRIAELVRREMEEKAKAEVQAREAKGQEARELYIGQVAQVFQASAAKYPHIARRGVSTGDILSHIEAVHSQTGKVPTHEEVLDHFERTIASEIEELGYTRKQAVEAAPGGKETQSTTINSGWTRDNGTAVDHGKLSVAESRDLIKRKYFSK